MVMGQNRLGLCAFGLSLFGLGLSTLLRILPMMGWQPSSFVASIFLVFSVGCTLAGVSIFAYLLVPTDAGIKILGFSAFLARNRNAFLLWLFGILAFAFMTWQSLTIFRLSTPSRGDWLTLNSEKSKGLTGALSDFGTGVLSVGCNEDDCTALADNVRDAAKSAVGWKARVVDDLIVGITSGLFLYCSGPDRNRCEQLAKVFEDAMDYPVVVQFAKSPNVSTNYVLAIGRRPQPEDVVAGEGLSPPTSGNFRLGDIWRNTAPKPGGILGWIWVCDDSGKCAWSPYGPISM
jgi:hypothetical protein